MNDPSFVCASFPIERVPIRGEVQSQADRHQGPIERLANDIGRFQCIGGKVLKSGKYVCKF
jgi:hypothetical protein